MSASTVSITANQTTTRRKTLAGAPVTVAGPPISGDPQKSITKDINNSFSTENTNLERETAKKNPNSGPVVTRRVRKPKPEKSKFATISSVLLKNLVLVLVIYGLWQMVSKLVFNTDRDGFSVYSKVEFERRIANVESLVKKTTKMLQVQVEIVDKKVENGLKSVENEFDSKIEVQNGEFMKKLELFGSKIDNFGGELENIKNGGFVKKEEIEGLLEEFRKSMGGGSEINLNEIREIAKKIIERELEKHVADGLGRVDYALGSGGAFVENHSEMYKRVGWFSKVKKVKNGGYDESVKMLSPSFGEPGQCFALKGSSGFVVVKLRTAIVPEAVTLEHVAKSVAFDRSSAPKDCRISGWLQKHDIIDQADNPEKMILLTEFTYDLEKSNAQTFDVLDTPVLVDRIRLDFTSNHGNPAHTCIYRLRVHGREPESIPMLAEQS